jgi:hypothetical protein
MARHTFQLESSVIEPSQELRQYSLQALAAKVGTPLDSLKPVEGWQYQQTIHALPDGVTRSLLAIWSVAEPGLVVEWAP